MKKYTKNIAQTVVSLDENTSAIITTKERFCIKGSNMAIAIEEILDHFASPIHIDDVVIALSKKYGEASLRKMINLLKDKNIIIDEHESEAILSFDRSFLGKTYYYTSEGKSLKEVVQELTPLKVGIIGSGQLVRCLIHELAKGDLLRNFNISITDRDSFEIEQSNLCVSYYSIYSDISNMQAIIKESDMLIAASNYHDHYLFEKINELCFEEKRKWLRVVVDGFYSEIGPLFIPGDTLCYSCMHTRRRRNLAPEEYVFDDLFMDKQFHDETKDRLVSFSSLYPLNSLTVNIACAELMKFLTNLKCNLLSQVLTFNALDFYSQIEYVYKDYACTICRKADNV